MSLTNITRTDLKRNLPGTGLTLKINVQSNISTYVGLDPAPENEAERTTVSGTFVCTTPFKEYEFIPKTGQITGKKVGSQFEIEYEGELFVPGDAEGLTAEDQISLLLNSRLAVVIPQMNGISRIMGETEDRPAMMSEVASGTRKSGEDGTVSMNVKFTCVSALPFGAKFTGTAPLS